MKEKKTEILLIQQEKGTGVLERILGLFLLLMYFYMSVFGCVFGFLSVFEIPCDRQMLAAALVIFGGFFFVLFLLGKAGKIVVVLTAFVYGIFLWRFFDTLCEGGNAALQVIRQVIGVYGNAETMYVQELEIYGREGLAFLLAVIFPWSGILFSALVFRGGRMFTVVSMAIVFSAALAVGKVPDFLPFCLMIGGLAGAFSTDGMENLKGQKAGALLLTVFLVLLLAAGQAFLVPILKPWFEEEDQIRTNIQNTSLIHELRKRMPWGNTAWATAGIGNGELGNAEFISSTNQTVLKVTTDEKPEETIYLRCYTGADYTGKRWVDSDDPEEERMRENYFDRIHSLAEENGMPSPDLMKIELESDAEEYDYMPYFSRLEKKQGREYSYRYYSRKQIGLWSERWTLPFEAMEEYYSSILYGMYTSYPEEKLVRLRKVCNSWSPDSLEGLSEFIVNYLEQNASYNLNVGRYPENEDFVDYFLFEKHEGYCVHFATAATLMFRMYGVPARYATGYVVPAKEFKKDGQGYSANVKDSRAHAWTEVYRSGQGWIPVEVTPGYTHMTEEKETEPHTQAGNLRDSQRQEKRETEAEPEEKTDGNTGIFQWVLWIVFIPGLLIAGVSGRRRILLKRKAKEGVQEIFYDVCGVLALAGFLDDADCGEEQYLEHAAEKFLWLDKEAFSELADLAMRANFGPEEMTEEEREFAWRMYQNICRRVYRELPVGKKIRFRFWDVFA